MSCISKCNINNRKGAFQKHSFLSQVANSMSRQTSNPTPLFQKYPKRKRITDSCAVCLSACFSRRFERQMLVIEFWKRLPRARIRPCGFIICDSHPRLTHQSHSIIFDGLYGIALDSIDVGRRRLIQPRRILLQVLVRPARPHLTFDGSASLTVVDSRKLIYKMFELDYFF